jgi:WD40 repeat protein
MFRVKTKFIYLVFTLLIGGNSLFGQFYNGIQMTFGKNRVQYDNFYWQYYRFEHFDTYFNEYGRELALYTEWYASQELKRLESLLDYTLERRLIFLIYNKLTDFRQSNIGLVTGIDDYNVGGVTRIANNKISLYFEGDHNKFQKQITASIAEVIINEMLYGNRLGENVANSMLISLPEWFTKGLYSYLGENWSVEIEDYVKDGILTGKYKRFNRLSGTEATYAGHSFWRYIEKTYGKNVIPNIIYLTQVNKNLKNGFLYVLGSSLKDISKDWYRYYSDRFARYKQTEQEQDSILIKRPGKQRVYNNVKLSPDGNYIAFVTNVSGQFKIWNYNKSTGKKKLLLKREYRIDQIPDYTFPVLAWHPNSKILSFITEEKGGLKLSFYNVEKKELTSRNLLYFEKVLDFAYSDDGSKMVMSAMKLSKTDIYVHNLASATDEQITFDVADDLNPRFINNSSKIIFTSNRLNDTINPSKPENLALSPIYKLYIVDYPLKSNKLIKISKDNNANHTQPFGISPNRFIYLGDDNGIINNYLAEYDSTISYIDTAIHYRYFTQTFPLSDNKRNIIQQDLGKNRSLLGQLIYKKSRYYIKQNELFLKAEQKEPENTEYRKEILKNIQKKITSDSIKKQRELTKLAIKANAAKTDSAKKGAGLQNNLIDINHYIFEFEKQNKKPNINTISNNSQGDNKDSVKQENKIRIYQTAFYINSMVNQVDFTFLNTSYQPFNGGSNFFSPGFNVNLKVGTNDLFEDYKVVGGLRFGTDFDSNEYMLSFENLKKRLDKQYVFHRQVYKTIYQVSEDEGYYVKTTTNEGFYILRYPFNQVFSIRGTASMRYDRIAFLSLDPVHLLKPNINDFWGGLKCELIFDNSRKLGINIFSGTRAKIFGEAYKQINRGKSDLFVLGADYRHYLVIHRNLILANRAAASTSFGGSRLIYFLGGVDNWINLSQQVPTFDNSIRIDNQGQYAFKALATNMRGFSQNIRNGNNFAVINNEIRWPFITYFARYPVSSTFWNSLQAIGFFDMGTAWTGWNPFSGNNAYDYDETRPSGQGIIIRVDSNRAPVVFGYGFGLRAQLLGYFVRADWAWGIENNVILPRIFYLSFNLDF